MSKTRPFKLIIFDIDNTLIYHLPRPIQILLAFAQEKKLPTHPDALQRGERRSYIYYAAGQADKERMLLGQARSRRNLVSALLEAMCTSRDITHCVDEAMERLIETPRTEQCPEEIRQIVRTLSGAGYHLAAISNRDGDLRPLLATHGLSEHFSFTLSGGRAGVYKPNPAIFRIALNTLGVAPAAALAIGDSYEADVIGAQQAGVTAVLLDPLGIFPEARCRTIESLNELIPWLIQFHSDGES